MRKQELNPAKLAALFRDEFRLCNVQRGETVVLLSDLETRRGYVAAAFAAADELGADAYEICVNAIPSWTKVGVATIGKAKGTLAAVKEADLLVCFHIPLFTRWLKEAVIHSGRRLEQAKSMRVTSAAGTDYTVRLGEYPTMIQYGFAETRGRFDHWGAGHVHTFPNESSAEGTVVIDRGDLVILPYNRYVQDEIRIEVREGFITKIEGGLDAKLMSTWLADNRRGPDDRDGYAISHLGWGLNPQSRWDALALHGDDPERTFASARTVPGNFLFSTGPNTQGGGTRDTLAHYDVPMRDCTVLLDNEVIIERGRLADERMIVAPVAR